MDFLSAYATIRREYSYGETDGVGFFRLPAFVKSGVVNHGFSARGGGVSEGCFRSLNLSFTRKEDPRENVMQNYRRFAKAASIEWERMVMDSFEHGTNVMIAGKENAGAGYISEPLPACDGLITNDPSIAIVTGHADCLALFFLDTANRAIGLAHAGYQGTLGEIAKNVIQMMKQAFKSEPGGMLCGIGPCISREHYEVDEELKDMFVEVFPNVPFFAPGRPGKAYIDLSMITVSQFLDSGIKPENITLMNVCTYEDEERLFSYRRDKGKTGGMAAYMKLNARMQTDGQMRESQ